MRFCVPDVKPGRPLRRSHFQNKIEGLSVTMCCNLECSYSANRRVKTRQPCVFLDLHPPSSEKLVLGIFELRDVVGSVTIPPYCTRGPGNGSPLVSKRSGK